MGGGLPRKWAQSFTSVPALANIKRASALEARKAAAAVAGTLGGYAKGALGLAGEAASAASEGVRRAALGRARAAKVLAMQGAQRTGRAVVQGGDTLRRHAASYIRANVDYAADSMRTRSTLVAAKMQNAFSEYSFKFMQAATDFAVRIISKQEQAKGQVRRNNAIAQINALTAEPKKIPEGTTCSTKIH